MIVDNSRLDIATRDVLQRLDEALALLEAYAPRQVGRLHRDVAYLWIVRYPTRGAFFSQYRCCLTELTFLARRDISPAIVASSILHEAVHARIHSFRKRLGVQRPDTQAGKEERVCRRAELAFALTLPSELGRPIIDRVRPMLEVDHQQLAVDVDWPVAKARQDIIDADALRLPNWFTRRQRALLRDRHLDLPASDR